MRLTLFFLLLSVAIYGQRLQPVNLNARDSVSMKHLQVHLRQVVDKKLLTFRISNRFKLTASTYINRSTSTGHYIEKLMEGRGVEYGFGDYVDILSYDIRGKIYVTKYNGLILRLFSNGFGPKSRIYTIGWSYKF